jgi:3-deoxy-D-manno-octulosonic-acid transferase
MKPLTMAMRVTYTLMLLCMQPVLAVYLVWRARLQPQYLHGWAQRFCAAVPNLPVVHGEVKRIWVHAVSVGEANAVSPLVKYWAKLYPQHVWVFSCATPTGLDTLKKLYADCLHVQFCYLPYDLPWLVSRTLGRLKPSALWLVETELWPNLLLQAKQHDVTTALVNARVSPGTHRGLLRWSALSGPVVQSLDVLLCQTQADANVFAALHRKADAVCGNLKFDVALRPDLAQLGRDWRTGLQAEQVLLFASSREGEEAIFLEAMVRAQLFKRMPGACVWIVPRHPQRFDEVFDAMTQAAGRLGVARPVRRSQLDGCSQNPVGLVSPTPNNLGWGLAKLVLGDSMGEMPAYYSAADVALLGGSWLPFGGQNLIEACAYGCPVWLGPHTYNFTKAAADALDAGAALRFETLAAAIDAFMAQGDKLPEQKKAAFAYARSHRGATQNSVEVLRQHCL